MSLCFMNRFRGLANFVCIDGPFAGRQVSVRYLNKAWHEREWAAGTFQHLTREQFENDILGAIGIVHAAGDPVTAGMICEVNANLAYDRHGNTSVVGTLCSGKKDHLAGTWKKLDLIELSKLFPSEDDENVIDADEAPASLLHHEPGPVLRHEARS